MSKKSIYTLVVFFAIMSLPYFEGSSFPYSIEVFAYAVGYSFAPIFIVALVQLIALIFKYEINFQSWFNVVGTLLFLNGLLHALGYL